MGMFFSTAGADSRDLYKKQMNSLNIDLANQHLLLGQWCEKHNLIIEAGKQYRLALKLDKSNEDIQKASQKRLRRLQFQPK